MISCDNTSRLALKAMCALDKTVRQSKELRRSYSQFFFYRSSYSIEIPLVGRAPGLDARASRVKCSTIQFMPHCYVIMFIEYVFECHWCHIIMAKCFVMLGPHTLIIKYTNSDNDHKMMMMMMMMMTMMILAFTPGVDDYDDDYDDDDNNNNDNNNKIR